MTAYQQFYEKKKLLETIERLLDDRGDFHTIHKLFDDASLKYRWICYKKEQREFKEKMEARKRIISWRAVRGRQYYAVKMRKEGKTYKEIGKLLDVSIERARQIVKRGERDMQKFPPIYNKTDVYKDYLEQIALMEKDSLVDKIEETIVKAVKTA